MKLNRHQIRELLNNTLVEIQIEILDHSDPTLIGVSGEVVGDSRNMLQIKVENSCIKSVAKMPGIFKFTTNIGSCTVTGKLLEGDAKRRSKRKIRHW